MDVVAAVKERDDRPLEQHGGGGGAENTVKVELCDLLKVTGECVECVKREQARMRLINMQFYSYQVNT